MYKTIPKYALLREQGPDHEKTFEVVMTIGDRLRTSGTGKSKKEAEQAAAREALKTLLDNGKNE